MKALAASALMMCLPAAALAQNFNYKTDVGYTRLAAEQGAALPNGSDQAVIQVEAAMDTNLQQYFPDTTNIQFTGKTLTPNGPTPIVSSHATTVGEFFYGNTSSMTPAISKINVWETNSWVNNSLNAGAVFGPSAPDSLNYTRIINHSWVGSAGSTGTVTDSDVLRRVDYLVQNYDLVQVASTNEPGTNLTGPQPLLADSYNAIVVGETNATSIDGTAAVDSFYTAGRAAPDLVAPQDATSWAAPNVSSAAALLVQLGHENPLLSKGSHLQAGTNFTVQNAETTQVVKAALMAGADRVTNNTSISQNITDYRSAGHQTTNGLDTRYGAGQLDIYNSYHIIASGQQTPGAIAGNGFDYNGSFLNTGSAAYTFTGDNAVTASLVWNAHVTPGIGGNFLTATPTLADFDLDLYKLGTGGPTLVTGSDSTIDNTQNLYLTNLDPSSSYEFVVHRTDSLGSWEYGLAWQLTAAPEPGMMTLLAVAGCGLLLRRRRTTSVVA